MAIITISSNCPEVGKDLALRLGEKTGWPVLSRTRVVKEAHDKGINIGPLEVSMLKSHVAREKLAREKEMFLAFATAMICEKAADGNLIYQGRAGNLLLPGIIHRIRVGLIVPKALRVKNTMEKLSLSKDKALTYIDQLDEDIRRWMKYVHRTNLVEPKYYDLLLNLDNISRSNALPILEHTAKLPEFRPTSKSMAAMEDLRLRANARMLLGLDKATKNLDLGVRASNSRITVTYMPSHEPLVPAIYEILKNIKGTSKIICTMAETTICWVAEKFFPDSDEFKLVIKLARRWGAAVELIRLVPGENKHLNGDESEDEARQADSGKSASSGPGDDKSNMSKTVEELISIGRYGGSQIVYGAKEEILHTIQRGDIYSLVVIGDIFLSRSHQARIRQTRELSLDLRERVNAPVITSSELQSRFVFGKRRAGGFFFYAALVAIIYTLVFYNQEIVMDFLGGETHQRFKWLSCAAIGIFIPFVAYTYGKVTGMILKVIGID